MNQIISHQNVSKGSWRRNNEHLRLSAVKCATLFGELKPIDAFQSDESVKDMHQSICYSTTTPIIDKTGELFSPLKSPLHYIKANLFLSSEVTSSCTHTNADMVPGTHVHSLPIDFSKFFDAATSPALPSSDSISFMSPQAVNHSFESDGIIDCNAIDFSMLFDESDELFPVNNQDPLDLLSQKQKANMEAFSHEMNQVESLAQPVNDSTTSSPVKKISLANDTARLFSPVSSPVSASRLLQNALPADWLNRGRENSSSNSKQKHRPPSRLPLKKRLKKRGTKRKRESQSQTGFGIACGSK
jgi:hypothetical protein